MTMLQRGARRTHGSKDAPVRSGGLPDTRQTVVRLRQLYQYEDQYL